MKTQKQLEHKVMQIQHGLEEQIIQLQKEEYIGKVAYIIPQVGYITEVLKPPMNYIIIAVVIGIMIIKQFTGKKKDVADIVTKETLEELSDIGKMEVDSEYSEDIKKSEITEENEDAENQVKTINRIKKINNKLKTIIKEQNLLF